VTEYIHLIREIC